MMIMIIYYYYYYYLNNFVVIAHQLMNHDFFHLYYLLMVYHHLLIIFVGNHQMDYEKRIFLYHYDELVDQYFVNLNHMSMLLFLDHHDYENIYQLVK